MSTQNEYDLVVVGAGPAGASAALHAARLGLSVALLERAKFPREKSCGDALSSQALSLVEELGLLEELMAAPHVRVNRVSYFAPGEVSVSVPLLKMDAALPVTSLVCRRVLFDQMLLEAAREEVEVFERCAVREVLVEDGRACGVVAEQGADDVVIRAGAVIGADGARSVVARQLGVKRRPEHRTAFARAYFRMVVGPVGSLEVHFLEDLLPGYVWIYPTESGMTNLGLTIPAEALGRLKQRPEDLLRKALASPLLAERFAYAEQIEPFRTAVEPTGHTSRTIHGNGFLLAGDAAGLANPCSGEGVASALLSGKLAAQTLAAALAEGDVGSKRLAAYPQALWPRLGPSLRVAERLLELRTPKAITSLIRSAMRRPHNAGWISGILIGSALPSEELSSLLGYLDFFSR